MCLVQGREGEGAGCLFGVKAVNLTVLDRCFFLFPFYMYIHTQLPLNVAGSIGPLLKFVYLDSVVLTEKVSAPRDSISKHLCEALMTNK